MMKLSRLALSSSKIRCLITGMMMFLAQPLLSSCVSKSLQQPEPNSFETWCLQKKSVPLATRKTIEALLGQAGTGDCKLADRQLKTFTDIQLYGQISDLKPLAGLTKLYILLLQDNPIAGEVCPVQSSICKF